MSKPQGTQPQRRAFHCSHCHAEILIPADLPPTSAPCPHCGKLVTSPAPKGTEPVPEKRTSEQPMRLTTKAQPAAKLFAHESSPEARAKALRKLEATQLAPPEPSRMNAAGRKSQPNKPVLARRAQEADKADGQARTELEKMIDEEVRRGARVFRRTAGALVMLGLTAAALLYYRAETQGPGAGPITPAPSTGRDSLTAEYVAEGWTKDARRVLRSYLNAQTTLGKAEHILHGAQLLPKLKHHQRRGMLYDLDTPEEFFQPVPLDEQDRMRGIFLMMHQLPEESYSPPHLELNADSSPFIDLRAALSTPTRIYAFFKHTGQGLKLDWEVFAQTKHRKLRQFALTPNIGHTRVFRVLIAQTGRSGDDDRADTLTYLVSDPANPSDTIRAKCLGHAPAARDLAAINWVDLAERKPLTRTATLELSWGGDPQHPQLLISRFLCWEFLGLGGK